MTPCLWKLVRNPDILAGSRYCVRTGRLRSVSPPKLMTCCTYAEDKRRRKHLDLIAANRVGIGRKRLRQ